MEACTSAPAYTSASALTTGKQSVCTLILRSPNERTDPCRCKIHETKKEGKQTGQNIMQAIVSIVLNHLLILILKRKNKVLQ